MNRYPEFFVNPEETRTITLSDEHWVKIKAEMSVADHEKYENGLLNAEVRAGGDGGRRLSRVKKQSDDSKTQLSMSVGGISLMLINILAWSFEGVRPTPVTVGGLKREWQDVIVAAIEEQNADSPLSEGEIGNPTPD